MAATCAACLRPVPQGAKFVLSGTEVFHAACATRIDQSIGWRQKAEITRLRGELDKQIEHARRLSLQRDDDAGEVRVARERSARLEDDLARARHNLDRARENLRRSVDQSEHDLVVRQLRAARADNDASRRLIALQQTLAQPAPAPMVVATTPESAEEVEKKEEIDASAKRFSLLELD